MDRAIFYLFLFFKLIIEMSIMSIIPIVSVILINKLLRKKILLKFQYILYLLILLRLLGPIMPKTSFSLFNKLDICKSKDAVVNVIANDYKFKGYEHNLDYYKELSLKNRNIDSMSFHNNMKTFDSTIKCLFIVWSMGVSGFLTYNSFIYIEFNNRIKRQKPLEDEALTDLITSLSKKLNITRKFKIVELELLNSPAIFGMRKSIILIPKGLLKRLEKDDLKNILIMERIQDLT